MGIPQPERVRRHRLLHLRRLLDRARPYFLLVGTNLLAAPPAAREFSHDVGWILLAFAIFNTYMLIWSTQVNAAVFAVFLTLELTEIILFIGNFSGSSGTVKFGGYVGIVTAACAWYTSAAGVANGMGGRFTVPVGRPLHRPARLTRAPASTS